MSVLTLGGFTTFLSSGTLIAALSGIGVVVAVPVGVAAAICGAASTALTFVSKKLEKKVTKHTRIHALALSKYDSINLNISKALNDNRISDSEFKNISQEITNYNNLKEKLRKSFREKKSKKVLKEESNADRDKIYKEIQEEI